MTYELGISVSKHIFERLGATAAPPDTAEAALVRALDGGQAALPLLPEVASEALALASNPATTARDLGELIMKDPPIAARFLATANSALYSRGRPIRSVTEAVARLGVGGSRDLVLQAVYASMSSSLPRFQSEVQASFQRSVLCAVLCRIVAPSLGLEVPDGYLCGLLHDIGEARVYRILSESQCIHGTHEAEALVRKYHARAGAELSARWGLPENIVLCCRAHGDSGPPPSDAVRLVRFVDLIVQQLSAPVAEPERWEAALTVLEVNAEQARVALKHAVAAQAQL